eukprot:scaffold24337_cov26-Tisochrysis_lutea.AAC.1
MWQREVCNKRACRRLNLFAEGVQHRRRHFHCVPALGLDALGDDCFGRVGRTNLALELLNLACALIAPFLLTLEVDDEVFNGQLLKIVVLSLFVNAP